MKKLFAILALTLSCQTQAVTYYFSDCQAGAQPGCVQGDDNSANPTNMATPLRTIGAAFTRFRNASPGDRILFAKGGSFTSNLDTTIQNTNSVASNPIIIGSYQPSWYSGSKKPILTQTTPRTLFSFSDGGTPEPDGGYVIRDLHLKGSAHVRTDPHNGIFTSQRTGDILLENLTIEGFRLGLYCGDDIPRVTLRNSKIINNSGAGILNSCDDLLVENNTFDNNGFGHAFLDHQIYLSGSRADGSSGVIIRNNTLKNSVHFNGPACTGVPLVGHGNIRDLLIENNRIIETVAGSDGCWGIAIDGGYGIDEGVERFSNVVIRGNLLVNMGNTGIACTSCDNWTIENNVLVWQFRSDAYGIAVPSNDLSAGTKVGDHPTTHVTIRNNSLYYKTSSRDAIAIKTAEQGTFTVSSNLVFFGSSTTGKPHCFDTTNRTINHFDGFDSNLCFGKSGKVFSQAYATMSQAQDADPRWNTDGMTDNPKLAATPGPSNGYSMALKPESPAINAGDIATCSPTSYGGSERNTSRCDIGAYEYVAP